MVNIESGFDLPISQFEMGLIILAFTMVMATIFYYCIHDSTFEGFDFEWVIAFTILFLVLLSYYEVIDSIFRVIGVMFFIAFTYTKLSKRSE